MKRLPVVLAMIATIATSSAQAEPPETYLGFQTGVTKAPRRAAFFRDSPHCGLVPHTRIFFVDGEHFEHDAFSYESVWFVYCGGYWYRSRGYRGPFTAIDVRAVPRPILEVSPKHWKRHPLGTLAGGAKRTGKEDALAKERDTRKPVKNGALAKGRDRKKVGEQDGLAVGRDKKTRREALASERDQRAKKETLARERDQRKIEKDKALAKERLAKKEALARERDQRAKKEALARERDQRKLEKDKALAKERLAKKSRSGDKLANQGQARKRAASVTVTKDRAAKKDIAPHPKKRDKKAQETPLAGSDRSKSGSNSEPAKNRRGRSELDASRDGVLARNQAGRH